MELLVLSSNTPESGMISEDWCGPFARSLLYCVSPLNLTLFTIFFEKAVNSRGYSTHGLQNLPAKDSIYSIYYILLMLLSGECREELRRLSMDCKTFENDRRRYNRKHG